MIKTIRKIVTEDMTKQFKEDKLPIIYIYSAQIYKFGITAYNGKIYVVVIRNDKKIKNKIINYIELAKIPEDDIDTLILVHSLYVNPKKIQSFIDFIIEYYFVKEYRLIKHNIATLIEQYNVRLYVTEGYNDIYELLTINPQLEGLNNGMLNMIRRSANSFIRQTY